MKTPGSRSQRQPRLTLAAMTAVAVGFGWAIGAIASPTAVKAATREQLAAEKAAAASQARINSLDDQTQSMLAEYRSTIRETESLRRYNKQLEKQIGSQREEMVQMQADLDEIERTNREIYPLMERMLATLEDFVKLDVPFLPKERSERIAELKAMMARADVTTSEKYRRILEAYSIETEYGRTIEAYQDKLADGRTVDFLRVGRVSLMYQTLEGTESGYWDKSAKQWVQDDSYEDYVAIGLKVARKQVAPNLIVAPVMAPTAEKN